MRATGKEQRARGQGPSAKGQGPRAKGAGAASFLFRFVHAAQGGSERARRERQRVAFTLLELMVVVGIMALVMATAVPLIHNFMHKDSLRQAVSDVVEACSHA